MAVPSAPPPLEVVGSQPFSFDPPIAGSEPNQWRYLRCTWADVLVVNYFTGEEFAIPRRWVGHISAFETGGIVVELLEKLELHDGAVRRQGRRIIEMPLADMNDAIPQRETAAVVPIHLESGVRSRVRRIAAAALALAIAACVLFAYLYRGEIIDSRHTIRTAARGF